MKVIKMGNGKNSVININLQSSIPVGFSHVPGYAAVQCHKMNV